jgi:hypothetical protein
MTYRTRGKHATNYTSDVVIVKKLNIQQTCLLLRFRRIYYVFLQ